MATPSQWMNSNGTPPLKSVLKNDEEAGKTPPLSGSIKAVQIAEPEFMPVEDVQYKRQFNAGVATRRLSGRLPGLPSSSSRSSLISQVGGGSPTDHPSDASTSNQQASPHAYHRHHYHYASERLLAQVSEWIEYERNKIASRSSRRVPSRRKSPPKDKEQLPKTEVDTGPAQAEAPSRPKSRSDSIDSQSSGVSLDRLQKILEDGVAALGLSAIPHISPRIRKGKSSRRRHPRNLQLQRTASSDSDFFDSDAIVPSCDAYLDNSKALSYSGGRVGSSTDDFLISSRREEKERQAWSVFKNEIIRLAHTLGLTGWRRVPLDGGDNITVQRLSGALTNAVYVVSPPSSIEVSTPGKKPPSRVLLRIYGPQVEQLIDRENELSVLRRLARKKIGPRLLGTFTNGRFEQFYNATTLTPANLREPETSKQIAKRMRELHDGIELLEEEKNDGPGVWKNWDRWLDNVEKRAMFLDNQARTAGTGFRRESISAWKAKGFVCGAEWPQFKAMVEKYRAYLNSCYAKPEELRNKLVFAHNDTQYGNILRVRPDDETSPLLQPANEHKQLVVIDFEYAAANLPGLEFANHFSEWTYNYHDATAPHACRTDRYPRPDQQRRFIKAYVDHRPQFPHAEATPRLTPLNSPGDTPNLASTSSSSSIMEFMLDARVPPGGWKEEEKKREEQSEHRVEELVEEARLWRAANSAQWVAWGIVQAKVPGPESELPPEGMADPEEEAESEADGFDYLSYAQERAFFFWGDCVLLGLVRRDELPESLGGRLKLLEY